MMSKDIFIEESYQKIKNYILGISNSEAEDIYALSFWYYCENDDLRFPNITIGYNTTTHYQTEKENIDDELEARWNFAHWAEDDIGQIGGENDTSLSKWFENSSFYFTEEEMENGEAYKKYDQFEEEFIDAIIQIVRQLFEDKIISQKFGKDIPIIIHELEYYDKPMSWTKRANNPVLIKDFIKFYDSF